MMSLTRGARGCHEPLHELVWKCQPRTYPNPEEADMNAKNPVSIETTTPLGVTEQTFALKIPTTKRDE